MSITKDGGKTWDTHEIGTNFHLTSITAIGKNYFVGSFANFNTSRNIPYHGDGDVYIFGNDTTLCPKLKNNTNLNAPYIFDVQWGVNGFHHDTKNKILYIFGSETAVQFHYRR